MTKPKNITNVLDINTRQTFSLIQVMPKLHMVTVDPKTLSIQTLAQYTKDHLLIVRSEKGGGVEGRNYKFPISKPYCRHTNSNISI